MKNTFTSTVTFGNAEELANYINAIGHLVQSINIVTNSAESKPSTIIQTRPLRGSKVNDTIIASLQSGPLSAKQLKQGLEDAGMSPGSLSTGLAALQKARVIERVGDGLYGLVDGHYQAAAE
jgi:hypothetical protein